MVNGGLKSFFGKTFCCTKPTIAADKTSVPEPIGVYSTKTEEPYPSSTVTKTNKDKNTRIVRRMSAISYKSCISNTGTVRSLSMSSLQSATSRTSITTANYDYFSICSDASTVYSCR